MKKNIVYLFTASIMLLATSCSDFLDVNDSPNNPQASQIPPERTLSAAQTQAFRVISGDNQNFETSVRSSSLNQLGNLMMNSWAGNSNSVTNPYSDEYRSIITSSFYDNIWDWNYRSIGNFQLIIDYNSETYDNHKAIARIMKSFYMQYIVDLYGDAPYSEAWQGLDNPSPAYDDDKQIYRDLYTNLDEAISLIENADAADMTVGAEDAMLGGDMNEWIRFANTIKLRLLIRQSGLTDAETVTYINERLTELQDEEFITRDITINPGYSASSLVNQNPFYGAYGYNIQGTATSSRNLVTASAHAADELNTTNDPRRSRLWTVPTSGAQAGMVIGIEQGEDAEEAPDNPSFLGPAIIPVPVGTNVSVGSSMNGYVMTLSEARFLMSEAAVRYPAHFAGYDARELWEEGIAASFTRLGATGLADYLTNINGFEGRGWDATADKVEAIMYQKWVALMSVNAHESWIDYNRTGYPETPLALTNNGAGRPLRLMYPTSEYVANAANVPTQTSADVFATGPFWLQ
ncbi:MAG TPA: SusD/RagB family nutrient-binding outer membrane lipoprotein [Flavobacterium sp.]|jgi:hypothetical protein